MTEIKISVGDIVLSTKGRDKDQYFLVVDKQDKIVYLADGKYRKVTALKKKNVKHLKSVKIAVFTDIANQIKNGKSVGNQRLNRLIKSELQNKQED